MTKQDTAVLTKLSKQTPACGIVKGPKDMGTMRTVVWKDGIYPPVGAKLYVINDEVLK